MKKVLIVGGSHSEIPLILSAKKKNLYVITTGNQKEGVGHRYSDECHLADYSDEKAIYKLAEKLKVDFICFGAHDLSLFSTVYTAEKLNIPFFDSYEITSVLHLKDRFKKFARENKLLTPKGFDFENLKDAVEFAFEFKLPFIVKPVDMGGGKGVSKVTERSQIKEAISKAFSFSKRKRIIIEEFFNGSLHSCSTFIKNQKVLFYYADDEYPCINNPYGVCTSTSPATDFEKVKNKLINEIEKVAELLKLKDGLLHVQYLQNNGEIKIIEYTRRMPGDLYNIPVELSTGFPYSDVIIDFCTGNLPYLYQPEQKRFVSRHCIIIKDKIFKGIYISEKIKNYLKNLYIWENVGETVKYTKSAIAILEYPSYEEMIEKTKFINAFINGNRGLKENVQNYTSVLS